MFEFGEGFIIDFDGGPMQFDRTAIINFNVFFATLKGVGAACAAETLSRWTEM